MINFPENYFQTEIREGFEVSSMMKRAWAAQIEVMQVIREVCERHNIKWFADYGTLLGAVRHKGFIPWDDDIDIGMTRDNLNKFIKYAPAELPAGYKLLCTDFEPEYDSVIVRVVNADMVSADKERMERYHGCPYALGIDIFPLDYLPRNEDERTLLIELANILLGAMDTMELPETTEEEKEAYIAGVEQLLNVKLDHSRPLRAALVSMVEKLVSSYGPEDSEEVTGIWRIIWQPNFVFPKEWFTDLVELPFEATTVPCPVEYDKVLRLKMGDNYMTPIRIESHDYPFYKHQEEIFFQLYGYIPE
ncbi:MAG: phosphorylcholine transferase LicD [Lachnospiraceae bacterium]